MINVINYHITDRCNCRCRYCFGKFGCDSLGLADAMRVTDAVCRLFAELGIKDGRISLAGGEPLCCPWADGLIGHIASLGMRVSLVTNGSLLEPGRIIGWAGKVSCVGLSIDSVCRETNLRIGRNSGGRTLSEEEALSLCEGIRGAGIRLKINTVVSRCNLGEADALRRFYLRAQPDRLKLFKMQLVRGVNETAAGESISDEEFLFFTKGIRQVFPHAVAEGTGDMENSYPMIDPLGNLMLNDGGEYRKYGNLLEEPAWAIMRRLPIDRDRFDSRYGKQRGSG